ncbi:MULTISPECIES: hypothetical protein [Paenibacillus]|uniref:hypothetical protein n=1 Tax=Paenibacillus TaxID=44249 RepID=UPI0022B8B734|nr:hypothetical protein [Paenibacillus caseinilyticus]MCZ8521952.1 hypothetical protein [Paenibacillus caseinilyticus]
MGTRLLSEHIIKKHAPHLRYIRIHSAGGHKAIIYAWNEELKLSDQDSAYLRRLAAGHLSPYVCFKVKSYDKLQEDGVPSISELPGSVVEAAMARSQKPSELLARINEIFTIGSVTFNRYDVHTGTLLFDVCPQSGVTEIEKELFHQYLYEIIPVGSSYALNYR